MNEHKCCTEPTSSSATATDQFQHFISQGDRKFYFPHPVSALVIKNSMENVIEILEITFPGILDKWAGGKCISHFLIKL